MKLRPVRLAAGAALAYLSSYGGFRATNPEVWERDGRAYVIYPADRAWLYYLFRPLAYVDGVVTGIGSHIGRHEEPRRVNSAPPPAPSACWNRTPGFTRW